MRLPSTERSSRSSASTCRPSSTRRLTARAGDCRACCPAISRASALKSTGSRRSSARDPRQLEQRIDEIAHVLRGPAHSGQVLATILAERLGLVLNKDLAEAVDRAQWRAPVMGDRVGERGELFVRRVELAYAKFELRVQRSYLGQEVVVAKHERDLSREDLDE